MPEYQQTAALWVRGILREHYGVGTRGIAWRTGGERVPITLPEGLDVRPLGEAPWLVTTQIGAWRAGSEVPPALSSLLLAAELTATAALLREESRGAHARSDFPRTETAWQRVIAFRRP